MAIPYQSEGLIASLSGSDASRRFLQSFQ
jgi:hypothetical protein